MTALPADGVSTGERSFTKEVNEVNLVFVAMRNGKFVNDLAQSDITVLDDKKPPASILGFRSEQELPLRIGLVIDTSNSVKERFPFELSERDCNGERRDSVLCCALISPIQHRPARV